MSKLQYCNLVLFYDECGNVQCLLYHPELWIHMLSLRGTPIPVRHLLRHFIFLSKTFFYALHVYIFLLKYSTGVRPSVLGNLLLSCYMKCQNLLQAEEKNIVILNHKMAALVTFVAFSCFYFVPPFKTKKPLQPQRLRVCEAQPILCGGKGHKVYVFTQ